MNAYSDRRHVGIDITFKMVDIGASSNATPMVTVAESRSRPGELLRGTRSPGKIITMEDGLMQTDGTWVPMPDGMQVPYWSSALSDASGAFRIFPTLTMTLSAPASSVGFTMEFDEPAGCWPSVVQLTAYNGESQLASGEFTCEGPILMVDFPVENYNKIVVEFLYTTVPYRRIKLYAFEFGIIERFDPDTIVTATFERGTTPDCSALPSAELTFTFNNHDKRYNMINPNGLYRFLQDGQVIETALIIDGQRVDMGRYYYTKAEAKDGALTAQITASDRVIDWDGSTYEGGTSGTWTLGQALRAVLGSDTAFSFGAGLESYVVGKAIPNGTTKRQAVQLLCQAARCTCWIDRSGTVICRALAVGQIVDTLDADNMESMDGIKVSERVDSVVLTVKDGFAKTEQTYTAGSGVKGKTINNPCVAPQNGQAVADWLLTMLSRRLIYEPINRGNPELIIGDTITVYNAYQEAEPAVIINQSLTYDGGLTAKTMALGEAFS